MFTPKGAFFHTYCALLAAAAVLCITPIAANAEVREFYIVTVHHDGKTNLKGDATHKPEAFPQSPLASTKGMWVKGPADNGDWRVRAFVFHPAEVTVHQGDKVHLNFSGVHGGSHTIAIEGVSQSVVVKRGTVETVSFKAETPGIVTFACSNHPPSMRGQVVVLPKH